MPSKAARIVGGGGDGGGGGGGEGSSPAKRPRTEPGERKAMLLASEWREGALAAAELLMRRKVAKCREGSTAEVMLRQIRYSQESIKGVFMDGRPISVMRQELASGKKSIEDIPPISVVVTNGQVYSADNRRLWTFRHSGMPLDMRVPVAVGNSNAAFVRKMTTPTAGLTIRRRGDEGFGGGEHS
mmetsp:Transcript_6572/g.20121  ORF Transcript_6572/g.20121 Transcript_6572/m.20121 type:complete len:185 (-) Transcript_6572:100-654(-)